MQQTPQKYVQYEQKQSIVILCLKENQRHVFSTTNERHKTHKTCAQVCQIIFNLYFTGLLYHRIYFHKIING